MLTHTKLVLFAQALFLAMLFCHSQAQITITANEFPSAIGEKFLQYMVEDTTDSRIPVNLGSAGPGQSWRFDPAQYPNGGVLKTEVVDPAATPFADSFPAADFAWKQMNPIESITFFQYFELTAADLSFLGAAVVGADTQWAATSRPPRTLALFPLTYNAAWTQSGSDTATVDSGGISFTMIAHTLIEDSVDAWGTIEVPLGTFPCLRLQNNLYVTFTMLLNGFPLRTWTVRTITYIWLAENVGLVASIQSKAGETNPNFTLAERVSFRVQAPTGVDEDESVVSKQFHLYNNYPNPFNPSTTISYQLPAASEMELSIYNLSGQKVRTLVSERQPAGAYTVQWDGRDEAGNLAGSGIYFYQLTAGKFTQTRKAILMK